MKYGQHPLTYLGLDPDLVLDDMVNAFDEAWDPDTRTEDQMRAALQVLFKATEFHPHKAVLHSILLAMAYPEGYTSLPPIREGRVDTMPPRHNPIHESRMDEAREVVAETQAARGDEE